MMILLVFQTKGQIRPTTLIIIGISMQTLFIALVRATYYNKATICSQSLYLVSRKSLRCYV